MARTPTTIIYFAPASAGMAKDLAARIRNDPRGIKTLLCWGSKFRDERDLEGCGAVIIQRSIGNADLIASCYQNFSAGTQIHFVDDNGAFEDEDELETDADTGGVGTEVQAAEQQETKDDEPAAAAQAGGDNQPAAEGEAEAGADPAAGNEAAGPDAGPTAS